MVWADKWKKFMSGSPEKEIKQPLTHNLNMIKNNFDIVNWRGAETADILNNIYIGKKIGSGYSGIVFELADENDRVIKIMNDSVHEEGLEGEVKKFQSIIDQMHSGKASIEDMHFFDVGKLGNSSLYYVIMPRIVPLEQAPFYKHSKIFEKLADACGAVARTGINNKIKSFQKYSDMVMEQAGYDPYKLSEEFELYQDTLMKIIKAGFRAYKVHGGYDLHSGNIGYLPQNPDKFFFFDM